MSRVIVVKYGARRAVIAAGLRGAPGSGGGSAGVSSFNTRTGAVTLSGADVTTALGYAPANNASLAAVAFSGAYADLLGTPFIPAAPGDIGAATAAQGALADTAVQPADLTVQLDLKVDKVAGYGLSQENFTAAEKAKLAGLEGSHYRGTYLNLTALQTALPTAEPGDYADVDAGAEDPVLRYIWDDTDNEWVAQAGSADPITAAQVKTLYESNPDTNAYTDSEKSKLAGIAAGATANPDTDSLAESGTPTNRWFTEARVRAAVLTGLSLATNAAITAADTLLEAFGKLQAQLTGHIGVGGDTHPDATTSVSGHMSGADKTKLNAIQNGATANLPNADLLDRANHTGSQAISTVSGLQTALDGKMANPMTTSGDTIRGGASGVPERVPVGTNGQVKTVVGGLPAWADPPGGGFTGGTLTSALNEAPAVALASASTVNIGAAAANTISITGTTTITAFDTIADGAVRLLEFAAALTLTHNGTSLILPTGANIVTAAGDVAEFRSLGSGNWRCVGYLRADGTPLAGGGGLSYFAETYTTAAPNATVPAVMLSPSVTEANADLVLRPKGSAAILANTPDNTATGGNKRGSYAVDLQLHRIAATQVASATYSGILSGYRNTASAQWTIVAGGENNSATATHASIGGGLSNAAGGQYSRVGGGNLNTAPAAWSYVGGGAQNDASGLYSAVLGGQLATTRGILGAEAYATGSFFAAGNVQRERFVPFRGTTNDTPTRLSTGGAAHSSTNQPVLPNNSTYGFRGVVVAREAATADCGKWVFDGLIRRGASAATTEIVGSVSMALAQSTAGAAGWVVSVTADTTLGCISVAVTGEASHTIRWGADIQTLEVVG